MSIKRTLVKKLRQEFLKKSKEYTDFRENVNICSLKIKKIIEEYSISMVPKDEFEVLKNFYGFWYDVRIRPGVKLRDIIGGKHIDLESERCFTDYLFGLDVKVTKPFYDKYICKAYGLEKLERLPKEILSKVIDSNNKILDLENSKLQLENSFDRLINTNTKKRWLKLNFPGIYDRLKEYENNPSI